MQPWEEVIHCAGETVVSQNSEQDCKVPAPRLHIQHQKDVGNGQLECHVQALQQPCQRFGGTDYESIEYTCKMPQPGEIVTQHTTDVWINILTLKYHTKLANLCGKTKHFNNRESNLHRFTTNALQYCKIQTLL